MSQYLKRVRSTELPKPEGQRGSGFTSASSASDVSEAERSPRRADKHVLWPQELLPRETPNSRIFTWGYAVKYHQITHALSASIYDHSQNLLSNLTDVRTLPEEQARPLIFIAHSLGGIFVKDVIIRSDG